MSFTITQKKEAELEVAFDVQAGLVRTSKDKLIKEYRKAKQKLPKLDQLMQMAYKTAMDRSFEKFIHQSDYLPLSEPKYTIEEAHPAKGMKFKAQLYALEDFQLPDYRNIELEVTEPPVPTEELLFSRIVDVQYEQAEVTPVDRPIQKDDQVTLDLVMLQNGQPLPLTAKSKLITRMYDAAIAPGFYQNLIGVSAGDSKEFTLTLPDNFYNESLRGQEVTCDVFVHQVSEMKAPTLEELITMMGCADLKALMQKVFDQLLEEYQETWLENIRQHILKLLLENTELTLPRAHFERVLIDQWERLEKEILVEQGMPEEIIESSKQRWLSDPEIAKEFKARFQQSLILNAIAKKENLKASTGDMLEILKAWSQILNRPVEELYIELQETHQLNGIMDQLLNVKVMTYLANHTRLICNGEVIKN